MGFSKALSALSPKALWGDGPISPRVTVAGLGLLGAAGPLPREWAAVVSELKKRPRPRSPSFTTPVAVMNTLAGLMSAGKGEGA